RAKYIEGMKLRKNWDRNTNKAVIFQALGINE
ncbi:unnamed protein product, partial [marine sediment metagenome]